MDYLQAEGHEENPRCLSKDPYLVRVKEKEEMSCFWIHNWSVWSNLVTKRYAYEIGGKAIQGVEHHQTRTCVNCNLVQKREL